MAFSGTSWSSISGPVSLYVRNEEVTPSPLPSSQQLMKEIVSSLPGTLETDGRRVPVLQPAGHLGPA